MPCDPNTLLEEAKCLNACIPQGMQQAAALALLCNIADAGAGGVESFNARAGAVTLELGDVSAVADTRYVLKSGDTMTGTLAVATGAVVADTKLLNLTQEWNNAGVTFTAIKLDVTNTAAGASSKLIDLTVGGVTYFSVNAVSGSIISNGSFIVGNATGGFTAASGGFVVFGSRSVISSPVNGNLLFTNIAQTDFTRLQLGGTTSSFPAIGRNGIGLDIFGADGAGPSSLMVYNTKTSATNFERIDLNWAANVARVWTEKGSGGGTARALVMGADATELMRFGSATTLSFFAQTAVVRQTSGANLTNNVTSGGTDDTIANFTDLTTYANDSAAIRNDIYQLARKLKQLNDGLRSYGLFT